MEIVIDAPPPVGAAKKNRKERPSEFIEAKILGMRQPRKHFPSPPVGEKDRRSKNHISDPMGGRVLTLLIPDGYKVPNNIRNGDFRILMRFVHSR